MQQNTETMCPVCTLYLRPGITLKQHLASHPKQKVIDALVKLSLLEDATQAPLSQQSQSQENLAEAITQSPVPQMGPYMTNQVALGHPANMGPTPGNHFFMYQQSMSTSSPHQSSVAPMPFNPFAQQYLVPAVYNAQMMPYFYQQQQLIMSSNGMPPSVRALPFEGTGNSGQLNNSTVTRPTDLSLPNSKEKESNKEEIIEKTAENEEELPEVTSNDSIPEPSDILKVSLKDQEVSLEDDPLNIDSDSESVYKNEINTEQNYSTNENSTEHDQHSNATQDSRYHTSNLIDHEECVGTPASHSSHSEWFSPDLNKACQTQQCVNLSPRSHHEEHQSESRSDYVFVDQRSNMSTVYSHEDHQGYEQSQPIYTSAKIINNTEALEFMSMDEIEGMQVIIGDFSNSPLIASHETLSGENPPILMTINGVSVMSPRPHDGNIEIIEHSILGGMEDSCVEGVNIRSDEKMPPRGELSGQESMGSSSDITWNHIQHYQDQSSVGCYENNSWDSSEGMHPYVEEGDRKDHISTVDVSALKQEVKESTMTMDKEKPLLKPIGLDINRKKVKKLVIKPKKAKKETPKFESVFTSILKVENAEELVDDEGLESKNEIKEEVKPPVINMCRSCDTVFKTKKELRLHNTDLHRPKTKVSKCQICDETFDMQHKFNAHLKIHPLECRICGKLFYRKQGLKLHTARHLGIKPFKCELCDRAFLVKQKLEEHRNCHTGNSPIKCSMCPETFRRHSNLVQHRNKHHFMIKRKIKDLICFCGEVFHSKKKLAWHKEIHDAKPKSCTQCSEKFIHMASLTRHMRRAHNAEYLPDNRNPSMSNAECHICKGIYLKTSLDAHLKTHTNQRPFSCSICNKEFTTKWNLKLHKWTHASRTQKPFKCELCRAAFIRENDYTSHMHSHKSVRPYTCNYCGAQFIRKSNCQRHVREHENVKTYNCNVCGKSFHRSYYLKDHMRVHSGDRPYSCHICGKTSTTKSNHNKHVQIHHAREPAVKLLISQDAMSDLDSKKGVR
ncbi:uncharacterized protein [Euwallacea fornicatus]|uniref:uncharacterized protein isoform X1 n=1 Tax=Euwallacea fornicatus TaxID=995702 RepID=UPI0033900226